MTGAFGTVSGDPCPCAGPGERHQFGTHCGPLLRGEALPGTPEATMRSRYTAYALGDRDHLVRTWHPRTRPGELDLDPALRWVGLTVTRAEGDEVTFEAHWMSGEGSTLQRGVLTETSLFERRGGRWLYVGASE